MDCKHADNCAHIIEPEAPNYRYSDLIWHKLLIIIVYAAPLNFVVNISEFFGINTVTATLEWTQQNDVTYNISIFRLATVEISGGSSNQLTLL